VDEIREHGAQVTAVEGGERVSVGRGRREQLLITPAIFTAHYFYLSLDPRVCDVGM
jgi:hypothetical protein